jgi:hypothetical protein
MASTGYRKLRREPGGLHLELKPDDVVVILHNAELLEMRYSGKSSGHRHVFTFKGPQTFEIQREARLRKSNANE